MTSITRTIRSALALTLLVSFLTTTLPRPAQACSCAGHPDLRASIDASEAAFVGSLVEKRDAGVGEFGGEASYVFEVEEWVKGDLGPVVEVRSAADGAGCGFEFFGGDRIGAFLRLEDGELRSGLCEQADPDALLVAANGPVMSETGIGHLLVAHGWSSPRLTVLDHQGATVVDLVPTTEFEPFSGTSQLDLCPDARYALQLTSEAVAVWDLMTLEVTASYPATTSGGQEWIRTVSCRSADATSILAAAQSATGGSLYEILPDWKQVMPLPGETWHIGTSYVIAQDGHESDPVLVDLASGEQTPLHETPEGDLQAISVAPHPSRDQLAMLETRFPGGPGKVESTLYVIGPSGEIIRTFGIPWEAYSPVWLDDQRLMVQAYDFDDWERSLGYIFDVDSQDPIVLEGWRGEHTVADGAMIYTVDGARVLRANTTNGEIETFATLPAEFAGPILLLRDAGPIDATTSTTAPEAGTTPPLMAPGRDVVAGPGAGLQWLAGAALVAFVLGLVWLAKRPA